MKRKILSLIAASATVILAASSAFAADNNPSVYIDDTRIAFSDQSAVIKDDRTLVPARGVFEAMNASVDWDEDTRTVTVDSDTNTIHIVLKIDDPVMEVYTFTSVLHADKTEVTLDVAPQILNDRTMVPLRAISEALNTKVEWNQEEYRVDITTKKKPATKDGLPTLSLAAPETAAAGEEFDVYITLANITPDSWVSTMSALIGFDSSNFEFVSSALCKADGTPVEGAMVESSTENRVDEVKSVAVTIDEEKAANTDGYVMKFTFKSLTGEEGAFTIKDAYHSITTYDTYIGLSTNGEIKELGGNELNIDATPVVVNGTATPEE